MKQYRGDHNESHGGYRINIDSNIVDAPVATVAQRHDVAGATVARLLPGLAAAAGPSVLAGSKARLVCRTQTAAGVWNKLADGTYLPVAATPTEDLPVCTLPFQVTDPATGARSGPDRTTELKGILPTGHLTWTTCEAAGTTLGKRGFWQKMAGGDWVSSPLTTKPDPYARHPALPL